MIAIAGVLLLIVIVFTVAVIVSNPEVFDLSIFGANIPVTTAGVYFTGAGAMLVLILAADLLRRGLKRERARRKQVRALQTAAGVKRLPTSGPAAERRSPVQAAPQPGTASAGPSAEATGQSPDSSKAVAGSEQRSRAESPSAIGPDHAQDQPQTSAAERQALLDEAEELTGDSADR